MQLQGKVIGFCLTGSHCNMEKAFPALQSLLDAGAQLLPILSTNAASTDTRYGKASDLIEKLRAVTGRTPLMTIAEVEPVGPKKLADCMVVLPCTGNTLAKLANAITDTPVTMACKAHLRNGRPVVLAITTNDGLGLNARNLGVLLAARNIFFVPFGQDNPHSKPASIDARVDLVVPTVLAALEGRQYQPLLVTYPG